MSKIRILLTDDHTLFRQGILNMLEHESDLEVVGEASNGTESVEAVPALRPDVVLMDIGMPGLSGFEATRQIKKLRPETKILFLTMYDDEDYLVECMEVGGSYLSPKMLSQLVDDFRSRIKSTHRQPRFATLTPREKEILKFLAEGQSVKEIAQHLNLSVKTVEAHKFNLMRKLDIHNKAQLVQYAIQKKIIQIPVGP